MKIVVISMIALSLVLSGCSAYIDVMITGEHDDSFHVVGMNNMYSELKKKKEFPNHSVEGDKVKVKIKRSELKALLDEQQEVDR